MNAPVKNLDRVTVAVLPPVARLNLRIAPSDLAAASAAFGLPLPGNIGQGAAKADRAAWCLGPDEWLLHAAETDQTAVTAAFAAVRAASPHSLTVISDREFTIAITGPRAQELLTVGCPLDLSRMAPGTAKRTLFDSAQVVLIRDAEDAFRIEVWRSFFPHVHELLGIATRELTCGI
ncbi:MAG: sarcosine oxidase subunit gamma family protein [Paracoccaceae bacterium]